MLKLLDFIYAYAVQNGLKRRIRPRVLQLPITGRCNSRCTTCGVWKERAPRTDVDPQALKKILQDPFFSKVYAVGVNGGEPSLHPAAGEVADSLLTLKRLKHIYVISNGVHTAKVLAMMETLKAKCAPRGVRVHLTISIDGVGDVHNSVRGTPTFDKTAQTLRQVKARQSRYCDVLEAGVTLSARNIAHVAETAVFLERMQVAAWYHPAVPNKRLHNFDDNSFGLLSSERTAMLATEFFFSRFKEKKNELKARLRAFLTYRYLLGGGRERIAGCSYLRSDLTITESLDLYLCAVASERVGNLKTATPKELLKSGAFAQAEKCLQERCPECAHYIIFPTIKGLWRFAVELLKPAVWIRYKLRCLRVNR
jgi:sulfatase maturation enzyme AslB (radical SAM superfamily)